MNVLWLASWYPNNNNPFDGDFIERHARAVSNFCRLTVLHVYKDGGLPKGSIQVDYNDNDGFAVYKIAYGPSSYSNIIEKIISFRKYRSLQKQFYKKITRQHGESDIIHVQVAIKAGLLAMYLKSKYHKPYIVTEHWSGYYKYCTPNVYSGNRWLNMLNKKVLQNAKLLITVSNNLGQTINADFVSVPYKVLPNVVNTNVFFYKPAAFSRFRFIHPSGLVHVKNPEGILAACKIVLQKGYVFELLMLGAENDAMAAYAETTELLNSTVTIKKPVAYTEVANQMQQSNALLMFSRHENMSCVVLEALCCGLPVIATKVGGLPEVINEANGILVESENVEALANAMITMMNNYTAYSREQIAAGAQQKFNYDTVAKQHIAIYESLLTAPKG